MTEKRSSGQRLSRIWLLLAAMAAVLILGDLNRRMGDARDLEADALQLQTDVAWFETENAHLETQVAEATSPQQVEAWAHEEAKMVREGEHLVIPLPGAGGTPTPTPLPGGLEAPASKWRVWWAFLFGTQP